MQKSAIEEIKELKARMESMTEQAKAEALDKAREAIGVLRELGLNNDTILKQLGFRGRAAAKESREESAPKDEPCPYVTSEQILLMTEDRTGDSRRRNPLRPKNSNRRH